MKIGYLLIGRLKSTRLHKKLLLKIKKKPIISHLIDRLKLSKKINEIIICTSTFKQDKPLAKIAKENNVKCFFGHPDDVLQRMHDAAIEHKLDYILTITADCPFVDPYYADAIVNTYMKTNADLIRQFDLPHGAFSYGIKIDALKKVIKIKDSLDTEVWGKYFTETGNFNVVDFKVKNSLHKRPDIRLTLDYPEDWRFIQAIFKKLYSKDKIFTLSEIIKLINSNPKIMSINQKSKKKFFKKWKKQSEIKLKKIQKVSKAVIFGCGSIGQRHIKNLKKIGIKSIIAFRSKKGFHKSLPKSFNIKEFKFWKDVIKKKPDIAIISNPTSLHVKSALRVIPNVKGIFIEKPLSNSLLGVKKLNSLVKKNNVVVFMGHNLVFHPIIKSIKKYINNNEIGELINIQCQVGQWLPDWHPYEDYSKSYIAKKKLGGGVSLTLIHEIHLAIELAGKPKQVCGFKSTSSTLNVDQGIDTISDIMIKHKTNCVSQIHLDLIQKPSHRSGLLTFERGWISYDFNQQKVVAYKQSYKRPKVIWSNSNYDSNLMYIDELHKFIDLVKEKRIKHSCDIRQGIATLQVIDALNKSYKNNKIIKVLSDEEFKFD